VAFEGVKQQKDRKLTMYESNFSRKLHREFSSNEGELIIITSEEMQQSIKSSQLLGTAGKDIAELSTRNIIKMVTYVQSEHTLDDMEDLLDEENVAAKSVAIMVIPPPLKTVPKERRQKALKMAWLGNLENVLTKATEKFMEVAAVFPPLENEAKTFYQTWSEEIEQFVTKINNTKDHEAVKVIDFKKSAEEEAINGDQLTLKQESPVPLLYGGSSILRRKC
jgi:hypothetical protein